MSPKKQSNFSNNAISFLDSFKKKAVVSPVIRQDLQKLKDKLADVIKSKKRKSNILNSTTIKKKITEIQTPNYLWIIFFVKKFISILKANVLLKKLAKMKNYHYNLIGDKTHYNADLNILYKIMHNNNPLFQNEIINKSAVQLVKEKIIKFKNLMLVLFMKFEVFQPDKPIISVWNFTMLFFVFINAFYIPMKIGFAIEEYDINVIFFVIFGQVPVWIFIFDILISLNTAYYSKGVFISDRYKIIKNYIKNFFLLDLVSIGPFLIGYFSNIGYVEMLFLLRILKLNASIKKLEEFLQLRDLYGARFQLIKLMGLIFYIAHVSCCGWQFLASFEISRGENHTWLDSLGIREASWEIRYVNSLYYSIVTMVTVGYGDITPQNTVEKIYLIFYIGVACGVFAYSVNEVGTILKEMYKSENDFK